MGDLNLEDFADFYIGAVFEAVQGNLLSDLDVFYNYVFDKVSEKTGFSREQIVSLHHPFHWNLFLGENSPLKLVTKKRNGTGSNWEIKARVENSPPEKSKLVTDILNEYRTLLQKRLDQVSKYHD